jgi:hypothetical protein
LISAKRQPLGSPRPRGADALVSECRLALVAGARAQGVARQRARGSARRFVRRHRRNRSYLCWVLRSLAASSALALSLLGLDAGPASADMTLFEARLAATNPLNGASFGALSSTTLGDLDGDGDLDLVAGATDGTFAYYKNTGSATAPVFTLQAGGANPLNGEDVGDRSVPALGDIDRDGDLDLVAGEYFGSFFYYLNTGDASNPSFALQPSLSNPLDGENAGFGSAPALVDLDGDGDLDVVSGTLGGSFAYFEHSGAVTPTFTRLTGAANPLDGQSGGFGASPTFGDLDGDGDADLVVGDFLGGFVSFENVGHATEPVFSPLPEDANPLQGESTGGYAKPSLGDLDGDGDLDLVAGAGSGAFLYFANVEGRMVEAVGSDNPLGSAEEPGGGLRFPVLADLDGDEDLDLVVGRRTPPDPLGGIEYYENTGSATNPVYVYRSGSENPVDGVTAPFSTAPTFGDLDGDGNLDLMVGDSNGAFSYYRNLGSPTNSSFVLQSGASNPLDGVSVGGGGRARPTFGDLDGDGDLDLLSGRYDGNFVVYENVGSAANPAFMLNLGSGNPFVSFDVGTRSTPSLGDADGDGDLDLVSGDSSGAFTYFENIGGSEDPIFVERIGTPADPLDGVDFEGFTAPTLGDIDGDGDLDLVTAASVEVLLGQLIQLVPRYFTFENSIVAPVVSAAEPTNPLADPFAAIDIGIYSAPAFADFDNDGDLDMTVGQKSSPLRYFENTSDGLTPEFVELSGGASPFFGLDVSFDANPTYGDLDGDGDLDLVVGESYGTFRYFRNEGVAGFPFFVAIVGASNPFNLLDVGFDAAITLGDLNGDGLLDLMAGELFGTFHYYENTGDAVSPNFVERTGGLNPMNGADVGYNATPSLGDLDLDGDLDLVVGDRSDNHAYYENTGSATNPVFILQAVADNPLGTVSSGTYPTPTVADIDRDGDFDVISGQSDGTLRFYRVPEPASAAMLGAGLGLLGLFDRLRRRRKH